MNIKWNKNKWYWGTAGIIIIIIILSFLSASQYKIGILTSEGVINLVSLETLYRAIFNPLWFIALWTFDKGRQENSNRHEHILLNIQGALAAHENDYINVSKIYSIIYQYDNITESLEKTYGRVDTVSTKNSNPKI